MISFIQEKEYIFQLGPEKFLQGNMRCREQGRTNPYVVQNLKFDSEFTVASLDAYWIISR